MIDATTILSKFVYNLKYEDLPDNVIDLTKLFIVDYYASCSAGYKVNAEFNRAMENIMEASGGSGSASILFSDKKVDRYSAAYMNAIYSHGADMDDGNRKAMGHIATHVMSSVFALAEELEASWKEVIVAINAGYEVYNRISAAAQPGLVHRGFHSTGTAGAIACGAACAKLMGLSEQQIYSAMSMAAVQASGLFVIMESGQRCKPLNPANAAKVGLISASLAEKGINGPRNPLESPKGWFHAMTDEVHENMITDGLGEKFTIAESYLKPYPSCRHTHCGIDAAIALREEVKIEDIEKIDIFIYHNAIPSVGIIKIPNNADDAKFSIYYATAIALLKGNFTLEDLNVDNRPNMVDEIVERISLIEDNSMEDVEKGVRGARMVITTTDCKTHESTVFIPKGDAANPFTWADVKNKLLACAVEVISNDECEKLVSVIRNTDFNERFSQPKMLIGE